MDRLKVPGFDAVDGVTRPVFALITESTMVGETEPHAHRKAQLLYIISGVLTVVAAGGIWTVPPNCALWIPGGVPHSGRASGRVRVGSLYVEPSLAAALDDRCGILFVQPLLRELIQRFDAQCLPVGMEPQRQARLVAVLLDELSAAPLEPIHLPMPTDRRLKRLTETMLDHPELHFTADEWGARVGASNRTLSRLFQRETGMSFTR